MLIESDDPVFGGYRSAPYGLLVVKSDLFQVDPGYPSYMLAPLEREPPTESAKLDALAARMKRTPWKGLHQPRPTETLVPERFLAVPPEPTAMKLVLSEDRAKALYELPEEVAAAIRASLPEASWGRKKKAATKKPATKKPATKKPATKKPATKKAATKKAATKKAATKKAATKKAATKKAAPKKAATKKPATKKPATKKPATKKPATKKARRG
jgi:adenylate kinase